MIEGKDIRAYIVNMPPYKIGDLVRYSTNDTKDEEGLSPSYLDYGIVIGKKKTVDLTGMTGQHSFLIVLWSDGTPGYVIDDDFTVLELLNLTGSIVYP